MRRIVLIVLLLVTCGWYPDGRVVSVPSPRVGYRVQRYQQSCVFAAFAVVTGIPEQSLIDGFKASGIGHNPAPELSGVDSGLLIRWLSAQGYHFENALWLEHGTVFHRGWRALVQSANVRGVVTSGGHAWVLLSADETALTVWDPYSGKTVRLSYTGVTGIFLPVDLGLEDYDNYEPVVVAPTGDKVVTAW